MRRQSLKVFGITLTVLSAVAVAATAQERAPQAPQPAPPPRAPQGERERAFSFTFGPGGNMNYKVERHGRLGILVDLTPDASRDTIGARVAGVTPGGPADRAEVRTGDIVVRVNGTRLVGGAAGGDEPDDQSRPGMRLIEIASHLEQGDTVRLDVRRDSRPLTLTFQAGESDADVMVQRYREMMPAMPGAMHFGFGEGAGEGSGTGGGRFMIRLDSRLGDLELVKVNPGLSEYFGTSEGLLVVSTPRDTSLHLRSGDVILTIGGRRPSSPAHAMRILDTYEAGENVSFEVMRQKRRVTVAGKMPAAEQGWRTFQNSFEMPAMPEMMELPHSQDLRELELLRGLQDLPRMRKAPIGAPSALPHLQQIRIEL